MVAQVNNSYRIVCCNTGADSTGIEPNLALSTALALCSELVVLQQQPEQEKAALYQLALTAYNFSPVVIIDEPQGIWLELSGCDRLFKGYNNLLDKLHLALLSQSFTADVGIAFSADAARLLCQPGFPSHLPCSTQIAEQLQTLPLTEFATSEKQLRHFSPVFTVVSIALKEASIKSVLILLTIAFAFPNVFSFLVAIIYMF